jgi:hypothetical protein
MEVRNGVSHDMRPELGMVSMVLNDLALRMALGGGCLKVIGGSLG